jgi:hypothetical protein
VDRLSKNFFKNVSYGENEYWFFHWDCNCNTVNNLVADLRDVLVDRIISSLILVYSTTRADAVWLFLCGFKGNFHKNNTHTADSLQNNLVFSISNLLRRISNSYERYDYHVSRTPYSCKRTSIKPALTSYVMHYVNTHPIREFAILWAVSVFSPKPCICTDRLGTKKLTT